jgi:ParB-like nuclease domain
LVAEGLATQRNKALTRILIWQIVTDRPVVMSGTMTKQIFIDFVPVERLLFDPQNPRLPTSVNAGDEKEVIDWMLRDATVLELMGSIAENGYFPGEPLLVTPAKNNCFYVVEGNRRLTAAKLLSNPNLAPVRMKSVATMSSEAKQRPKELPVLVYPKRDDILEYLGYRHITGVKQWEPLAKAKYLEQLLRTIKGKPTEKYKRLAKEIGSRENYVSRLLTSLALYNRIDEEAFFGIEGLTETSIDFSLLTTALSYSKIIKFLGLQSGNDPSIKGVNKSNLKELTSWLFQKNVEGQTRLVESRRLKDLNKIVENKRALLAFRNGAPISDAIIYTDVPTEVYRTAVFEGKARLEIARDTVHLVENLNQGDADALKETQQIVKLLQGAVDGKIVDKE